jgi:hypothetical protein
VALAAAGCGGGKDETQASGAGPSAARSPAPQPTVVAPTNTTRTEPRANNGGTKTTKIETAPSGGTSPESQPGGAGDEEAARSEVTFTGSGGTIAPVQVRVAPFIQIKVTLKSKDDRHYAIAVAGKRLDAGLGRGDSSVTIPGLRQEKKYKVRVLAGEPGRLTIVASSEPGP